MANKERQKTSTNPEKEDNDYSPYENRQVKTALPTWMAVIIIMKGQFGLSVFQFIRHFINAGLLMGFLLMFAFSAVPVYSMHLLLRSEYALCKRNRVPYYDYSEATKEAFKIGPKCLRKVAKQVPYLVNFCLMLLQFWKALVYMSYVDKSLRIAMEKTLHAEVSVGASVVVSLIPFILINLIKSWKIIGYLSIYGLFSFGLILGIAFYYLFQDLPCINVRPPFGKTEDMISFFLGSMLSLETIGVMLAIERDMTKPRDMVSRYGIINMTSLALAACCIVFGFMGYWRVGDYTPSHDVQFLPRLTFVRVASVLYTIGTLISHTLQMRVAIEICWHEYVEPFLKRCSYLNIYELGFRTLVTVCEVNLANSAVVIVAIGNETLTHTYEIVSFLASSSLLFIFPPMMEICIYYEKGLKKHAGILVKNSIIIAFGAMQITIGISLNILEWAESHIV